MLWKPYLKSCMLLISFTKSENSANKLDPSSNGAKDKERSLEEKSKQQREDPISPPHVEARGMCTFEGPRFTLYDLA